MASQEYRSVSFDENGLWMPTMLTGMASAVCSRTLTLPSAFTGTRP